MTLIHLHKHDCVLAERLDGKGYPYDQGHRKVLEEKLGRPLRDGCEAHHVCEVKACKNPDHLEELTGAEHRSLHHTGRDRSKDAKPTYSDDELKRRSEQGKRVEANRHLAYTRTSRSEAQLKRYEGMTAEKRAEIGRKISEGRQRAKLAREGVV